MRSAHFLVVTAGLLLLSPLASAQDAKSDPAVRIPRRSTSGPTGNFLSRVNEFMMVRAKDHPEWWMDQRVYREGSAVPAEFIVIVAARGSFIVRVRNFKDLPSDQQAAVLEDPMWQAFLRAKRDKTLYPGTSTIYSSGVAARAEGAVPIVGLRENEQPTVYAVNIDATEMIRRRPVEVRLAGSRGEPTGSQK